MDGSTPVLGTPVVRGAPALFPVTSTAPVAPDYLTGPEADRRGELHVAETRRRVGAAPPRREHRRPPRPPGRGRDDHRAQADTGRSSRRSCFLRTRRPVTVPVSCVEQGRWGRPSQSSRSRRHAPNDLRRVQHLGRALHTRDRGARDVGSDRGLEPVADCRTVSRSAARPPRSRTCTRASSPSCTSLVADLRPEPDQCGVVAVIGGRVPWARSVRPAVDARRLLGRPARRVRARRARCDGRRPTARVRRDHVPRPPRAARTDTVSAPGIGTHRLLAGAGVTGHTLEWNGVRIHVAAFASD